MPDAHDPPTSPPLSPARIVRVLVAIADAALRSRVTAALDGERFELRFSALAYAQDGAPEVIVTDQSLSTADLADFHPLLVHGEVGVLLLGRTLPADVVLPSDFTRRELRLATRLLAQIVGLRRQQRQLALLAESDNLTGLPNRRALEEHFRELTAAPAEAEVMLAVFDLDNFKRVNAEDGYLRGDSVLRGAAKTLASRAAGQFVARLGGDEFVLLGRASDRATAMTFLDECRRALGTAASLVAQRPLSASAGVAWSTTGEWDALLAAADTALRAAKQAGGKQLVA